MGQVIAMDREQAERSAMRRAAAEAVAIWRVVQVSPGAEGKVIEALWQRRPGRGAVVAYAPMETVFRATVGRRELAELRKAGQSKIPYDRPLIRGYVFADLDDRTMASVHELEGAQRVLMLNGAPAAIRGRDMLTIMRAEQSGTFDLTRKKESRQLTRSDLKVGDEVRVTREPFSGFVAVIQRLDGNRRAQLLLTAVGYSSRTIIAELADLERAAAAAAVDKAGESTTPSSPTPVTGGDDRRMEDTRDSETPIQGEAAA